MVGKTHFERAIFLSWYCSKGDCAFCYMSTQKDKIKNPHEARRSFSSVLAEAFICRKLGWGIEFLSGGYDSFSMDEIIDLVQKINIVYGSKQWLNIGVLSLEELGKLKPFIAGVSGAVECVNWNLREKLCPSKPVEEINQMFSDCEKLGIKKSVTVIIGLGESLDDVQNLIDYVKKYNINRLTFYALNPHEGTVFKKGPESDYYAQWISTVRKEFPKLEIIAGSWVDRLSEISLLLESGANAITKFPSIKLFGTKFAKQIEEEVEKAGFKFEGSMTKLPEIDLAEIDNFGFEKDLTEKIKGKVKDYLEKMRKN
ncbi:radical SAM protein [Candidatus Woesearchaeota archaeon]|nr:radical SAM protein [Candidatus Woesearchaeota archaeon]